jgi:hypothetical protein
MEPHIHQTLTGLYHFFNVITRKSISVKKLGRLQEEVITIINELEMYFPPTFFDIMVHLLKSKPQSKQASFCTTISMRYFTLLQHQSTYLEQLP